MGKLIFIVLSLSMLPFTVLAEGDQGKTVEVFSYDGSRQCESESGTGLTEMGERLIAAGVRVMAERQGVDGRMYPMVCGAGTGRINIYEIKEQDRDAAAKLGFMPLQTLEQ